MKEILDIGAGREVAQGATRAIDKNKRYIQKMYGPIIRPKSLHEYRSASAEKIPYPDGFFNKVVSIWALGPRIFSRKAYSEVARVLKPYGRVEVRILGEDRRYKRRIIARMAEVRLVLYKEYKGVYSGHENGRLKYLREFVLCFRR